MCKNGKHTLQLCLWKHEFYLQFLLLNCLYTASSITSVQLYFLIGLYLFKAAVGLPILLLIAVFHGLLGFSLIFLVFFVFLGFSWFFLVFLSCSYYFCLSMLLMSFRDSVYPHFARFFFEILILKGHQNCIVGSKTKAILFRLPHWSQTYTIPKSVVFNITVRPRILGNPPPANSTTMYRRLIRQVRK